MNDAFDAIEDRPRRQSAATYRALKAAPRRGRRISPGAKYPLAEMLGFQFREGRADAGVQSALR